jgi:flagellar basal body P-ring formation protein FlgA
MKFRRNYAMKAVAAGWSLALCVSALSSPALAEMGTAVVPTQIIYPGEVISAGRVEEVDVTNPNLAGGYAQRVGEVTGLVSKRTLLPGRTITLASLREPYAVTRGSAVRLVFAMGTMTISASGTPLEDAAIGDVIRVRNTDSGITVSGTVMADGTIQVVSK